MSIRLTLVFISSIILSFAEPPCASAEEQQFSIEQLESLNEFENLKGTVEELGVLLERMGRVFEQKCLSAFGHTVFCRCIRNNRPGTTSFEHYILAATQTKEELGFNKLKKEEQQLVIGLRQTRDQCVQGIR